MSEVVLEKRTINPREEATLNAGQIDAEIRTPIVILQLDYPESIKHLVTYTEELHGQGEHRSKVFKVHNQSNFLVYAQLVKTVK